MRRFGIAVIEIHGRNCAYGFANLKLEQQVSWYAFVKTSRTKRTGTCKVYTFAHDSKFAGVTCLPKSPLPFGTKCKYTRAFRKKFAIGTALALLTGRVVHMEYFNKNLDCTRIATVIVIAIIFIGITELNLSAQETSDLPESPRANILGEDASAPDASLDDGAVNYPTRLTFGERLKIYESSFKKPESLIGPVLGAGVGQLRNTPPEWGQGAHGFGERLASGYARSVIARTIAFGVAAADGEDSRFVPSHERGIWRRTRHAALGTFVSRTRNGDTMPAISRFTGVYSAAFIANTWEPPSQATTSHALQRGSTALLSSVGWHVFEEFWPDIRSAILHKHN